jgi:hypothetical protein
MRFEVDTRTLRESAMTVEEVMAQLEELGIADDLRPVAVAMPGGRTAWGLHHVATAWQAQLAGTRWQLRELGRSVSACADAYDAVDRAVRDSLARARRGDDGSSR